MWPSGLTLAMTLTLNFQSQIQNLLYLSQKWSDCHETKSKHIDWTLGLKWDHRVWLWPWPWPWIFKVKYRICYISAKNDQIASKRKANISIELQASNVTNGFELDHNLDLWILKVKCDLDLWPHRWPWPWIFMVKFWNSYILEWEGWLTLHKGSGSRSFMTMIMTIWWPRSGVWIYQVVTGVTSAVGMPSTHLVGLAAHILFLVNFIIQYKELHIWRYQIYKSVIAIQHLTIWIQMECPCSLTWYTMAKVWYVWKYFFLITSCVLYNVWLYLSIVAYVWPTMIFYFSFWKM